MKINGNIIAHRGVHDNKMIPENSLKAFEKAIDLNYPIELDIQLTRDNKLVVFHDFNLTRLTARNEYVQDLDLSDIEKITLLNTKEKIPTFKEVLKLVDERVMLDIEIKNTNRIKDTCDALIKELGTYRNFIVKSFNPKIVRYMKKNYPNIESGLLITDDTKNKLYDKILSSNFVINYAKPDFIAISKNLLKKKKFQNLITKMPILVWTITGKEEITNQNLIYVCNNLPFKNE